MLEVAINANGEMEDIVVRRSSGHPELDQAALAILKLATPFDPFPSDLRKRHGSIRFAYEWQFLRGDLVDYDREGRDASLRSATSVAGYWMP